MVHPAASAVSSGLQENLRPFLEYSAGLQTQRMLLCPNDGSDEHAYSNGHAYSMYICYHFPKVKNIHLCTYRVNIIKYFIQFSH